MTDPFKPLRDEASFETGLADASATTPSDSCDGTGPGGTTGETYDATGQCPFGATGGTATFKRRPLCGATYGEQEALTLLNAHYLVGKSDQEVAIFRITDDGSLIFTPNEQFRLDVQNIFVEITPRKIIPVEKFWKEHRDRHQKKIIFSPRTEAGLGEFNLWRGFAVQPCKGKRRARRLYRHILEVICRGDREKCRYLIRWLAWCVQNPDCAFQGW